MSEINITDDEYNNILESIEDWGFTDEELELLFMILGGEIEDGRYDYSESDLKLLKKIALKLRLKKSRGLS